MAEDLTPADVESYTGGRLSASDPGTQRALDAALGRVRRFCGWHVSPVKTETLILDRPDSPYLVLPTMKITSLNSITVDGVDVDLTQVRYSREAPGVLERLRGFYWSLPLIALSGDLLYYTSGLGQVQVDLDHGYTADEAADFREAVLETVDQATLNIGTGGTGSLIEKKVDDVVYRWVGYGRAGTAAASNPMNMSVLYEYRLLPFV